MSDYEPNSVNAMFARILQRLDTQDNIAATERNEIKERLTRIQDSADYTNGRVTKLEKWRDAVTAKTAVIASFISAAIGLLAWFLEHR